MTSESQETDSEDIGPQSVLVVDDDEANRKLLKAMLRPLGVDVVEAAGGKAALELLLAPDHNIDLVLLDMMMPEVDGTKVLETLSARGKTPAMLVLVVTAHNARDLRRTSLKAGAIDFITKPVDRFELQAKCRTLLELAHMRRVLEERDFQNQQRLKAVVAGTPSAISVRDLQNRFTMVNEAFCQLFGLNSADEVIGRTQEMVLPPNVLESSQLAVPRLLAGESVVEEEPITRGQETCYFTTQRFPLRNSAGKVTELVTVRTDITYRRNIEQEAADSAMWTERISAAIGDGRLLVYSQPIVDIGTRQPVNEELLIRLEAAEGGEISAPDAFLPQCEHHGLLPVIDRYMVGRAVDVANTGRAVSVNVTGQTIQNSAAMSEILETLSEAGQGVADKITFEITESTALGSPAHAKAFSESIRALGCRVALDDFGTGYGTFTELRHLELQELKIDLAFVQKLLENRDDERVVSTIAFVAKQYGLTTVAEGVETEAILEKLAELGIDRAQGYLFGKPTPICQ